ncbi:MAG: SctF chaperone SctG [Verrucomicrobia bacterium]|nr:SctF chaperone SctG [Verrucomicrobiota bacterium]
MTTLEECKEDFALLAEGGFVAIAHMDEEAASKLFHAAQLLNAESTIPKIGLAAIALHKLETKRSCKILEEVLQQEPNNHRAAALLGISYLLSNQKIDEGEKLLKQAMEQGDDPATQRLGELWLEVLDKGVRKTGSPATPKKPKKEAKQSPIAKGKEAK